MQKIINTEKTRYKHFGYNEGTKIGKKKLFNFF